MDAIGAGLERGDRVDHAQAAILMAVPVHLHVRIEPVDDSTNEADDVAGPPRRRMADRVGDADAYRTRIDRDAVELLDLFRLCARRVLGHVHDRDPVAHRETHRLRGLLDDPVEVPLLGELANR